jgi:predicted TIM-barrel fold metal-dependent hydrolase
MSVIDAHAHLPADHAEAQQLLAELDVQVLNISLGLDAEGKWREGPMSGVQPYQRLAEEQPRRFAWCTAFDPPTLSDLQKPAAYVERTLATLAGEFSAGALACKVWKNVGMELRDAGGHLVGVDSSLFTPIFEFIAREGRVLIMHTGEPRACFVPLDPRSPHYEYYSQHPQWHMYGKPDVPSHEQLVASRDAVLERHPNLRVVGAHLGSLEFDVAELEVRLRRYPNFSVDTAERLLDLALQPVERVRAFFEAYPDRVLFGSDLLYETAFSAMSERERAQALSHVRRVFEQERAYYGTAGEVTVRNRQVQGLALPEPVLAQLFERNARRCYGLG